MCVHWALNALYSPSAGQLTISFRSRYSFAPPTGTSAAAPSSTGAVGVAGVFPPVRLSVEQAASAAPAAGRSRERGGAPEHGTAGGGRRHGHGTLLEKRAGHGAPDDTAVRWGTFPRVIVVGGEALIDLVPVARPPGALLPRPGGGPYNTALALGRLGAEVAFCSRVSADGFGENLLTGLRAAGVDLSLVQRGPEPTTLAVPSLAPDGSASYGFYVEGTADRLFTLPPTLPASVRALALGTCSLVLEPGASAYETLLRRESRRGLLTLLDPNIRPALIADPAAYRARFLTGLLPYASVLKLSEEDAFWLGAGPATGWRRGRRPWS